MPLSSFDVVSAPCLFWASHFKCNALSCDLCKLQRTQHYHHRPHDQQQQPQHFCKSVSAVSLSEYDIVVHIRAIKLRSLQVCLIFLRRRSRLEKEVDQKMRHAQAGIERDARAKVEKEAICHM